MTIALDLWVINLALFAIVVMQVRDVIGIRGRRAREARRQFLREAVEGLRRLPPDDAVRVAWHSILSQSGTATGTGGRIALIRALDSADDAAVAELREAVSPAINLLNDAAELVDEGLVRPKDIARHYPDLHAELLGRLALISPFIWYESILGGRGRWGYRVLRLQLIFERLRPVSSRKAMQRRIDVEIHGFHFLVLPELRPAVRLWLRVLLFVRSPTINVRSKVAQIGERRDIEDTLEAAGVNVRRTTAVPDDRMAVDW